MLSPAALLIAAFVSAYPAAGQAAPAPAQQSSVVPVAATATTAAPSGSKIWMGRESEFESFLQSAPVDHMEDIKVGVTKPRHALVAPGGLAGGFVFKPLQPGRRDGYFESYKSEIAAYELDKLMGLGMVPPTVERKYKGDSGSAQLWVDQCKLLKTVDPNQSGDIVRWNRQVYRQRVWDNLIGNIDRNAGNLLVDPGWNLILIDHSRAFTMTMQMPFAMTKIDREFFERLKSLDEATLKARLGSLLFDGPKPILKRRDTIVKHFNKLIAEKGEAAVLIP
jgi:hypothetical protein